MMMALIDSAQPVVLGQEQVGILRGLTSPMLHCLFRSEERQSIGLEGFKLARFFAPFV